MHWLALFFGTYAGDGNNSGYLFWSGIGSDIGELAIIGAIYGTWRKAACHEPRCWRFGHYHVDGTPYKACHKHHPAIDGKPRKGHMTEAFHRARAADGPVRAGTGTNPATEEGLNADRPVVPPAAAAKEDPP
jgi:hypothetical protein